MRAEVASSRATTSGGWMVDRNARSLSFAASMSWTWRRVFAASRCIAAARARAPSTASCSTSSVGDAAATGAPWLCGSGPPSSTAGASSGDSSSSTRDHAPVRIMYDPTWLA